MKDSGPSFFSILVLISMALLLWASGAETDRLRSEAVERGYAEWVVDSSGNAEWRWVEGADQ